MTDETTNAVTSTPNPASNTTHQQIQALYQTYLDENEKFEGKGVKAAASRARKALGALGKLTKVRRAEIQESKLALSTKAE